MRGLTRRGEIHYIPADIDRDAKLKDIAGEYNVSLATASRWRKAIREGDTQKIQHNFTFPSRILGILWSIGYDAGEWFYVRSRHREVIEEIRRHFGVTSQIIVGRSHTDKQHRLKIMEPIRSAIMDELEGRGWTPRKASIRNYPTGDIDHREFIGAWIELHSYFYARKGHLRIYGNEALIEVMNRIISALTGVGIKKPQQLHNRITFALNYQSKKEVAKLIEFFNLDYKI